MKHDWTQLFLEYMQGKESRYDFCARKKLPLKYFYVRTKDWDDKKRVMVEKAKANAVDQIQLDYEEFIKQQLKLLKLINAQAMAINKECLNADGTAIIKPLRPKELSQLANALDTSLKTLRLLAGKSTEISENRNVHASLVDFLEEQKNDSTE